MAPRHAARCCGAVHSRLACASSVATAALEGVWITDAVLAMAFARYCRASPPYGHSRPPQQLVRLYSVRATRPSSSSSTAVSVASSATPALRGTRRRFVSNVPGPLEARRRLGKRKMTEQLGMQLSLSGGGALPPPWALPDAADLRQWQWTPPRDAALFTQRNSSSDTATATATTTTAKGSISSFGVPKWLIELADLVDPKGAAAVELPETTAARSATAAPFFAKVEAWTEKYQRRRLGHGEEKDTATDADEMLLWSEFDSICREFQVLLRLAGLTVDEVHEAFDLLWGSLEASGLGLGEAAAAAALLDPRVDQASTLLSAVVDGVGACHLLQATDYGLDFWRSLFACVAQLPERHAQTGTVAARVLLATPATFVAQMDDILPRHMCAIFLGAANGSGSIARSEEQQTREKSIADALQHIELAGQDQDKGKGKGKGSRCFIQATTDRLLRRLLANHDVAATTSFYASTTSWLFTLAHMPQVRQERFFEVLGQIHAAAQQQQQQQQQPGPAEEAYPTLRTRDLCDLLLAQWTSRGYATPKTQTQFRWLLAREEAARRGRLQAASTDDYDGGGSSSSSSSSSNPELAVLALTVYRSDHSHQYCLGLCVSLWRCLQLLGRGDELAPSMTALVESMNDYDSDPPSSESASASASVASVAGRAAAAHPLTLPPVEFFEAVAWATNDLHVALHLHSLYAHKTSAARAQPPRTRQRGAAAAAAAAAVAPPFWSIGFWNKFATRLADALERGELSPGQVNHALDLHARLLALRQNKQTRAAGGVVVQPKKALFGRYAPQNKKKGLGAPTVALIEKLAVHFALAPNLAPRCAFRGVEDCRALIVAQGVEGGRDKTLPPPSTSTSLPPPRFTASPMVLRALFHTVTRDLDSAQPGRTSRLRWFVDIVRREHGEREAMASGHALERWRSNAARHRKRSAEEERWAMERARWAMARAAQAAS